MYNPDKENNLDLGELFFPSDHDPGATVQARVTLIGTVIELELLE